MVIGADFRVKGMTVYPGNVHLGSITRNGVVPGGKALPDEATRNALARPLQGVGVKLITTNGLTDRALISLRANDLFAGIRGADDMIEAAALHGTQGMVQVYSPELFKGVEDLLNKNPKLRGAVLARQIGLSPIDLANLTFSLTEPNAFFHAQISHPDPKNRLSSDAWQTSGGGLYSAKEKLSIHALATVLSYAQNLFEGLKVIKRRDGSLWIINPEYNARRMQDSAKRLNLTPVPVDLFIKSLFEVVMANSEYVPNFEDGILYVRPVQAGIGAGIGVAPSSEETFFIYVTPVGAYYRSSTGEAAVGLRLLANEEFQRAAERGTGHIKAAGNYGGGIFVSTQAKADNYSDAAYIRRRADGKLIFEEAGTSNLFVLCKEDGGYILRTPRLNGSILPGSTRNIIIAEARRLGIRVVDDEDLTVDFVKEHARRAFSSGTAVGMSPIDFIKVLESEGATSDLDFTGDKDAVRTVDRLKEHLFGIFSGDVEDINHWMVRVA